MDGAPGLTGDFSAEEAQTPWDQGLTSQQLAAARSNGQAHRLLAGPGTGKTLVMTRHVLYLVQELGVEPNDILALTFTRAATFELRKRVRLGLGEGGGLARIGTLHSFALRQLLGNHDKMRDLGEPLRIADDWEQRYIIEEDIKGLIERDLDYTQERFNALSADWSTLNAEANDWEARFPDPRFLAAWKEHRRILGYSLRAELVYRLKRCIEEFGKQFSVDTATHLLVDEYQDLNPCDLSIIAFLVGQGAEPYVAGDDDQSIYGFRHAFPLGIRRFPEEYVPCGNLPLTVCKRCDESILGLGLFVAGQDYSRIDKAIRCEHGRGSGEVRILRFENQYEEASGVARIARHLIEAGGFAPHDLLILLRSDRHRVFSKVLHDAFAEAALTVASQTGETPLDSSVGRKTLNVLRLAHSQDDHLALRTLLQLSPGIGATTLGRLYSLARADDESFSSVVRRVAANPKLLGAKGQRVADVANLVWTLSGEVASQLNELKESPSPEEFLSYVQRICKAIEPGAGELQELLEYLEALIRLSNVPDLDSFFQALQSANDDVDNLIQTGKVNIMTMHKAKGLTAKAVFVVACEDRLIPGRNQAPPNVGDERRLLYVSLTRAEHHLYVTYAQRRFHAQSHYGRPGGGIRRITRFLEDGPVPVESGADFALSVGGVAVDAVPLSTRGKSRS